MAEHASGGGWVDAGGEEARVNRRQAGGLHLELDILHNRVCLKQQTKVCSTI